MYNITTTQFWVSDISFTRVEIFNIEMLHSEEEIYVYNVHSESSETAVQ